MVLLAEVSSLDMPFVQCEEDFFYCQKLKKVMQIGSGTQIPRGVDLALRYFERPYTKLHLSHGGRSRNLVLELEVLLRTSAQNALLIGCHNVDLFTQLPVEWGKNCSSVGDVWWE